MTNTPQYLYFGSVIHITLKHLYPIICTIVSEKWNIRLNELQTYLLKQKYSEQLIENEIYKAKEHERAELLFTRRREINSNIIPFVHTYNPRNLNVNCIIN